MISPGQHMVQMGACYPAGLKPVAMPNAIHQNLRVFDGLNQGGGTPPWSAEQTLKPPHLLFQTIEPGFLRGGRVQTGPATGGGNAKMGSQQGKSAWRHPLPLLRYGGGMVAPDRFLIKGITIKGVIRIPAAMIAPP